MSMPETKSERDEFLLTTARTVFEKCIIENAATPAAKSAMVSWLSVYAIAGMADRRENQNESDSCGGK